MTTDRQDKAAATPKGAARWLSVGGSVALILALAMVVLAWRHASDERHSAEDVKERVAAEMNRIEAEAARMEREAGNDTDTGS